MEKEEKSPEYIKEKIQDLINQVMAIQADNKLGNNYRDKVKELSYWRRRFSQLKKKKEI